LNVQFALTLTFPSAWPHEWRAADQARFGGSPQQEVAAALWAWETFGGVGARTRRGFGALRCLGIEGQMPLNLPPNPQHVKAWIAQGLEEHVLPGAWSGHMADVPHLAASLRHKPVGAGTNALPVWQNLINKLRDFRQQRPGQNTNHPGRSYWPEPDAIRRLTGQRLHRPESGDSWQVVHPDISRGDKFPRAAFGLPIVFHFKDNNPRGNSSDRHRDPRNTSLQGSKHDRLASRLILRPLACANGQVVGLAVILEGPPEPPGGLILKGAPGEPHVQADLDATAGEANFSPLNGEADVLQRFLDWL
jgi:CRISPR-associated protein Cmr1